jgi:hypothetical protein
MRFFLKSQSYSKESNNCQDSKIFGMAYHKILEQSYDKIKLIAQKNNIAELDKFIENFKLGNKDKNLLLTMIKKLFSNPIYQKYVLNSNFMHAEQNLCHFITKDHYIFRLEAIIDAIISPNGIKKIILDYKTINSLSAINKTIAINFYWTQLLFYKYIYESSVQDKTSYSHEKINDLCLLFQSKSKLDNHGVVIKKFSDLPNPTRKTIERDFHLALNDYINYILKHKNSKIEFKLPNSEEVKSFRKNQRKFCVTSVLKYLFKASIKGMVSGSVYGLLWLFYNSQYFIFSNTQMIYGLLIFILWAVWFTLKK